MTKSDLKNIILSFERPAESRLNGIDFLITPPIIQGGALYDQIVTTEEELTYEHIIEFLLESSESVLASSSIEENILSMLSAIVSLAFNVTSISLFPDEYKDTLDYIKENDENYVLDNQKINALIKQDLNIVKILDELVQKEILRKNRANEYIVRKKILTNIHVSFIQIA